ncbi:hypothetical protein BK133_17330 [Paenibacillus sp. FSL H8-0548]|uniref:hypothetical protein n=1 Tax=Paenibacillus sp. FSL H8-0548 TaxID=1920422 RepID=UPI00096BF986|nr:hypothetical protein [Paenibacillus sp. FSL H8-0548]OMF29763.1 hypothetical protein BK133_17330 [Paenibacillus sp. FSL H8-0548]
MTGICRLCLNNVELKESHIIPKMFYKNIIRNSITGKMRVSNNVNRIVQDGLKTPFLCGKCEQQFSKYETYFSNEIFRKIDKNPETFQINSKDNHLRYFILSVSWRYAQFVYETELSKSVVDPSDGKTFTMEEIEKIKIILENWRKFLLDENILEIQKIQMHLIPYVNIEEIECYEAINQNSVIPDFRTLDNENDFIYSFLFFKVPHLVILCTLWGNTDSLKGYLVGKVIKSRNSKLPKHIHAVLNRSDRVFKESKEKLSENQKQATFQRVQKELKDT